LYTLQGLGSDYDTFVTAISLRSGMITMTELQSLLLSHEARLKAALPSIPTVTPSSSIPALAFYAQSKPPYSSQSSTLPSNQFSNSYTIRGRGNYRGRGRGRSYSNHSDKPQCQICLRRGHTAAKCYHRFDLTYTGSPSSHVIPPQSHQALIAEPVASPFSAWFLDSVTHVTADYENLQFSIIYSGTDAVHVGNGADLKISHVGSSTFTINSHSLRLTNILYVPAIIRNLMSISQLTKDNYVIIEFTYDSCFVKNQVTQKILVSGTVRNDLYQLDLSAPLHQVFHVDHVPVSLWHSRLGHYSPYIVSTLKNNNKIAVTTSKHNFCSSCCQAKAHKLPFVPSSTVATAPL
jgi:GAG-pre-integrase domain